MESSNVFMVNVPARIIGGAAQRAKSTIKGSSKSFRKLAIICTLALHPIHGDFQLKVNNGKGSRVLLTFGHRTPCKKIAIIKALGPTTIQITISGDCSCQSTSRLHFMKQAVLAKLAYMKKWSGDNKWLESAGEGTASVASVNCIFGRDDDDSEEEDDDDSEEEGDDGATNEEAARQQLREVVTESEIEEGGREFSLEVGGLLIKMLNLKVNLMKFFTKSPIKKTKKKLTRRYYKN